MRYFGVEHCSSGVHVDAVQHTIFIIIAQEVANRNRNPYPSVSFAERLNASQFPFTPAVDAVIPPRPLPHVCGKAG